MSSRHALFGLLVVVTLFGCARGATSAEEVQGLHQGMSEKEVVEKIGKPWDINRSDYGEYETAQFVYKTKGMSYDRIYIYFEDHRLTSIQY